MSVAGGESPVAELYTRSMGRSAAVEKLSHAMVVPTMLGRVVDLIEQRGEKVAAVIVPTNSAPETAQLGDWVKPRLRSTKAPEIWEFRTELPYNGTGKLLRRALKDGLAETESA